MGEYSSDDCPEPRPERMFALAQMLQGQFEQKAQQILGSPSPKQLGGTLSGEPYNGIFGLEWQQH